MESPRAPFTPHQWVVERARITEDGDREILEWVPIEGDQQPLNVPSCTDDLSEYRPSAERGTRPIRGEDDLVGIAQDLSERPLVVAFMFLAKVAGWEVDGVDSSVLDMGDVVTEQSINSWDPTEIRRLLEGRGISSKVRYIDPWWAKVYLAHTPDNEAFVVDQPTLLEDVLGIYLRFVDELADWRVHMIGPPDLSADQMPSLS